ncbi:hypothetical protein [Hungatella hathewayi]|uniref:hypothetical protein n=1 Tax=Hungatella hathewayi TaxID=154046 RepID=UPI0035686955
MNKFCPDCGSEFENRQFCPKCGLMGLTEEEYKAYKKAMEDTSENVIEESMKSEEPEKDIKQEPPVEVKIFDSTGIETEEKVDEILETLKEKEIYYNEDDAVKNKEASEDDKAGSKNTNDSCFESCSGSCHVCCDDDLKESTFNGKKAAKLVIGVACLIGAIIAVKVLKRKM